MHLAIRVLRATLVTGYKAGVCIFWADANQKGALSDFIKTLWIDIAVRSGEKPGRRDSNVAPQPTMEEAKKVSSTCSI